MADRDGLKERETLYKLMISQLRYDGFEAIASNLAKVVNIISACPPMARLHQVVNLGLQAEAEGVKPEPTVIPGLTPTVETSRGIDLEYEPEGNEVNGEWQNSTTDETFMSNLELQKVDQDCDSEPEEKQDDLPSANTVLYHILRITSDRKFTEPPHGAKPIPAVEPVSVNGEVLDAESICEQVKIELVKYNISQEVFAKAVLGKSQGYLSEMLKHGESFFRPQDHTHYKGWLNFETMRQFLQKPEAERLRIYYHKGEELKLERMKRRQIEIGLSEDASKKKRRYIPTEAKAVMEDYYHRNKYLSIDKRQNLANQLAIPEQCVSDYFKNLRSRKKHEERMKCLLKGLEYNEKHPDKNDSDDEDRLENGVSNQVLSCSQNIPVATTSSAVETSPIPHVHVQFPSVMRSCGRRFNVSPPMMTSTFQPPPDRRVSETDLVASKIAALTQSQKSPHKQPALVNVQISAQSNMDSQQQVVMTTTTSSSHHRGRESPRLPTSCLLPPAPSAGTDVVETFSLEGLIDSACSSVMLQGGTPETEGLEVGQQIYVVHVNNHAETSVRN